MDADLTIRGRLESLVKIGRAELALEVQNRLCEISLCVEAGEQARAHDLTSELLDLLEAESWPFGNMGSA